MRRMRMRALTSYRYSVPRRGRATSYRRKIAGGRRYTYRISRPRVHVPHPRSYRRSQERYLRRERRANRYYRRKDIAYSLAAPLRFMMRIPGRLF